MSLALRWHVARTKARQEHVALENLTRQGYETFLPRFITMRRRRTRTARVHAPLFPGYLFVGLQPSQQAYAPIRSTLGVIDLVRFGDLIPELPETIVTALRQQEELTSDPSEMPFRTGDRVLIIDGPFAGLSGVFDTPAGADRVRILLDLLGKAVSTTIHRTAIAPSI